MAIVVIGGQTRNIGKTSLVASLIVALPELQWTAFKITQFGHGICSANGKPCGCDTGPHTIAISEERDPTTGTDSARFLAAGAVRSFWVRTRQGQLADAIPRVRKELTAARNAIVESNSILDFIQPDLYLTVLDSAKADFKLSAKQFLSRADAVLWNGARNMEIPQETESQRNFIIGPPDFISPELIRFVAARLDAVKGQHQ
jgi:molybdopterin-guanine dinucleotide biosynthesis protein